MRAALIFALAALTGCQNIHGQDTERCIDAGYSPKTNFMSCIVKLDRQRLAAWKAAQPKPKKEKTSDHRRPVQRPR